MRKLFFSLFCISCLALCSQAVAQTNVSGYQWGTWDLAGSPYVLTGTVTVLKSEPLNDRNGNGVWDPEEPYDDLNGNGRHDSGEPYDDLNGNGQWDPDESYTDLDGSESWTEHMPPLTIESGVEVPSGPSGGIRVYGELNAAGAILQRNIDVYSGGKAHISNSDFAVSRVSFRSGTSGSIDDCYLEYVDLHGTTSASITNNEMKYVGFGPTYGGNATVSENKLTDYSPLRIGDPDVYLTGVSGNTYTAGNPAIEIYGDYTLDNSRTLGEIDGISSYWFSSGLIIGNTATLTFDSGLAISGDIYVDGHLNAREVDSRSIHVRSGGNVSISDCEFGYYGVSFLSGSSGTVDNCNLGYISLSGTTTASVINNTMEYINFQGSYMDNATVSGNSLTDYYPLRIFDPDIQLTGVSGNLYTANNPVIQISGILDNSRTLGEIDGIARYHMANGDVTISEGATLTIESGVRMGGIHWPYPQVINVYGQLNADEVTFDTPVSVYNAGTINISNCDFINNSIGLSGNSRGSVDNCNLRVASFGDTTTASITRCNLESIYLGGNTRALVKNNNVEYVVFGSTYSGKATVSENRLTHYFPLRVADPDVYLTGVSGNTYTAGNPAIEIYGDYTLDNTRTLGEIDGISRYSVNYELTINNGVILTVDGAIYISGGLYAKIYVHGQLDADRATFNVPVYVYTGGNVNISNSNFGNCTISFNSGSSGSVNNCNCDGNLYIDIASSSVSVHYNDFSSGSFSVSVSGSSTATYNMEYNWWGSTDPTIINAKIEDHNDEPSRPWVDFEPFLLQPPALLNPVGTNVIYLDFASYIPPPGYGTVQEIASYIKQYVSSRFTMDRVEFVTTFDGPIEEPGLTSVVVFGGINPDPDKLGSASTDPGNTDWTDTAYVYTDQSLFSSMPNDATEYKYMLANTAAHEIGHLLGYDHSNAAGMPFMYNGDAMEARIRQDMLLGELGEITQQRYTYVVDTDFDLTIARPQLTYIPKESVTPEQFVAMLKELDDFYDYQPSGGWDWSQAKEVVVFIINLASLIPIQGTPLFPTIITLDSIGLGGFDTMLPGTMRMELYGYKGEALLELDDSNDVILEPIWDEAREAYMFYVDPNSFEDWNDIRMTISFVSPFEDSNQLQLTIFDPNYEVEGQRYMTISNVSPCADINGDSITNFVDFAILANHYYEFGTYTNRREGTDLNRDEYIGHKDLFILTQNWLWDANDPNTW